MSVKSNDSALSNFFPLCFLHLIFSHVISDIRAPSEGPPPNLPTQLCLGLSIGDV